MFLVKKSLPYFRKNTPRNKKVILPLAFLYPDTMQPKLFGLRLHNSNTDYVAPHLSRKKPEIEIFYEKKIRPIEGGDDEIKCHICLSSPILLPTVTNCLHCFCFHCIRNHMNKKNTCPVCDADIHQLYVLED
jgi:hypothetical protein